MKRKVIKQKTAYTITLPIKWVREHNIDKNTEIELNEDQNKLVLSSEKNQIKKKIELTLNEDNKEYIRIIIENHYLQGYDEIKLKFKDGKIIKDIQEIVSNLNGMEIIIQENNNCTIAQTSKPTRDEVSALVKRTINIIKYSISIIKEDLEKNEYNRLEQITQLSDDVRRFMLFCTRTLHKIPLVSRDEESFAHLLLERLILIQHNQKYLYRKISKIKNPTINTEVKKTFSKTIEQMNLFINELNNQEEKELSKITKIWQDIYNNHNIYKNCNTEESIIAFHSMNLSKLIFLISQPSLTKQYSNLTSK